MYLHRYSDTVSYGELFLQNEYEMSVYNLDEADVAGQRQRCAYSCVHTCVHLLTHSRTPPSSI